jgi:hypothetical protein
MTGWKPVPPRSGIKHVNLFATLGVANSKPDHNEEISR